MSRPPRSLVPGRGAGRNMPGGYLLGRVSQGKRPGPVQLLDLTTLAALGVGTSSGQSAGSSKAGFGFFEGGTMSAGELLGTGTFTHDTYFASDYTISATVGATAMATMTLKAVVAGTPTVVGHIVFPARTGVPADLVGVLTWVGTTYTLPKNTPIQLYAPSPKDATLGGISGTVNGTAR